MKPATEQTQEPRPDHAPELQGFYRQIVANSKNSQKLGAKIGKYFLGFLDIASGGYGGLKSVTDIFEKENSF